MFLFEPFGNEPNFVFGFSESDTYLYLKTHLQSSSFLPTGSSTNFHVMFWWIESISDLVACRHVSAFGAAMASSYVRPRDLHLNRWLWSSYTESLTLSLSSYRGNDLVSNYIYTTILMIHLLLYYKLCPSYIYAYTTFWLFIDIIHMGNI